MLEEEEKEEFKLEEGLSVFIFDILIFLSIKKLCDQERGIHIACAHGTDFAYTLNTHITKFILLLNTLYAVRQYRKRKLILPVF